MKLKYLTATAVALALFFQPARGGENQDALEEDQDPWNDFSNNALQGDMIMSYEDTANFFGKKTADAARKDGKLKKYKRKRNRLNRGGRGRRGGRNLGATSLEYRHIWQNGVVRYTFDPNNIAGAPKDKVRWGASRIQLRTGITMKEVSPSYQGNVIFIKIGPNLPCSSFVGEVGGRQTLNLRWSPTHNGCMNGRIIKHEFLHALGQFHEMNSPGRDNHVRIDFSNIQDKWAYNFDVIPRSSQLGIKYDHRSVMHYNSYAGAKDYSKRTIYAIGYSADKNAWLTNKMGKGDIRLSDLMQIHLVYHCQLEGIAALGGKNIGLRPVKQLCDAKCPCNEGQGGCTDNAGCKGNLVCKKNVGKYTYRLWAAYWISGLNVCQAP